MITFTGGNLLEADAEAFVDTVNTVGVMGKGIALMFRERFADNYRLCSAACKAGEVRTGQMFVTEVLELDGPRWIVNFPTKRHCRSPSRIEWIAEGLQGLRRFLIDQRVSSVAVPPLGAGNGGLPWVDVREMIAVALEDVDTRVLVYEPSDRYLNARETRGVEELTPARALITELVRRYRTMGVSCSLMEIQKLAWFLERAIESPAVPRSPTDLRFEAHRYGPYAQRLVHLLDHLDGSYLQCERRLADAGPWDLIWFDDARGDMLEDYLRREAGDYLGALDRATSVIDGFESPFGLELLATVDWLLCREKVSPELGAVREALCRWGGGEEAAARKNRLFDDRALGVALEQLMEQERFAS